MTNLRSYNRPPLSRIAIAVISTSLVTLLFATYCRWLNIHITFLQAESGLYLQQAFAQVDDQWTFLTRHMLSTYNSHFIPLAFIAEFLQAKLYRTSEAFWFWRQMLVCGALGAACGLYIYRVASDVAQPRHAINI